MEGAERQKANHEKYKAVSCESGRLVDKLHQHLLSLRSRVVDQERRLGCRIVKKKQNVECAVQTVETL